MKSAPSPSSQELAGEPGGGLLYFDALTSVGPRKAKHPAHPWSLEHLRAEMEHCSISAALVSDVQSVLYDAGWVNRQLSARLEDFENLHAVWNLLPEGDEMPGGLALLREIEGAGIRAVSIHPKTNAWLLTSPGGSQLLQTAADAGLPVLLARSEIETFDDLARLLDSHPTLNVIFSGAVWSNQRQILPLLRQFPRLHITFDNFQIHYGPEDLVAEGLEDQLVFGSNAPIMSAGAHRTYIDLAEIPVAAAQKIASGNLLRLTGLPAPEPFVNPHEDDLMAAIRQGAPLPVPAIDMHMHILDEGLNGGGEGYRMSRGGPTGVRHLLERMGFVGGGFMSWNGTVSCDAVDGNRCTTAALEAYPESYWGLATLDPTHYSTSEMEAQIQAIYANRRFIGMKPYQTYRVEYHHPSYDSWWKFGNEHGLYAGIHRVRPDYLEVETLAARYPNVRWVVYHCGASYAVADQTIECLHKFPNVFAEITLTPVPLGIIDYLVEHGGADRILYGSDLPMRDPRQQLGWVVFSRLSRDDKVRLLRENALKVIAPHYNSETGAVART